MKNYDYREVNETMRRILTIQDKQLLAYELAKLMVKYTENLYLEWDIKDIDIIIKTFINIPLKKCSKGKNEKTN